MSAPAPGAPPAETPGWMQRLEGWLPFATLALSGALALAAPAPLRERGVTLLLTVVAAGWVLLVYTRAGPDRRTHRLRMGVYYAGLLVLAAVLMWRNPIYFVFAITCYFHADLLRPSWWVFVGTGTTSFLITTITWGGFPQAVEDWTAYVVLILIQTFLIGAGILWSGRVEDISEERRRAVVEMEATLAENAGLHAQLVAQAREAGVADERQRMAREIHDTIAQGLAGIVTQLEAAGAGSGDPAAVRRHVANATALARESLVEARRSVDALGPGPLHAQGLPDALSDVAHAWSGRHGVRVDTVVTGPVEPLHPEVEATLLRIAQEALANVAKHADASRVGVTLSYAEDVVTLDVRDDGVGFSTARAAGGGFGLTSMRQRIARMAGTFAVESEPGSGTAVSAIVPLVAASMLRPSRHPSEPETPPPATPASTSDRSSA